MARIAGVDLPRNKRIEIALTYIYGIGRHAARIVLDKAGVALDKKSDDLDENDVRKIRDAIETAEYRVEGDLRRDTQLSIKRLIDLGSLRGSAPPPHPPR